jgi:hypothetical protein
MPADTAHWLELTEFAHCEPSALAFRALVALLGTWPRPAGLLAAPPPERGRGTRGRRGQGGGSAGPGLAAEELLLAETELGAELFDLLFEEGFALHGAVVHGLPVASLAPGLELHGAARADGTGTVGQGGAPCRAGGGAR